MEQRKNFFDELDNNWDKIVADTYAGDNEYKPIFVLNILGNIHKLSITEHNHQLLMKSLKYEEGYDGFFEDYYIKSYIPDEFLYKSKSEGFIDESLENLCLKLNLNKDPHRKYILKFSFEYNTKTSETSNEEFFSCGIDALFDSNTYNTINKDNTIILYTDPNLAKEFISTSVYKLKNNSKILPEYKIDGVDIYSDKYNLINIINYINKKYNYMTLF